MQPGSRLGPYEIVAPIGAGGMGEVYRARDTRLGRDVAIKVLPPEFADDPERLRRFEQEARAVAALSHPNVLALFDVGSAVVSLRGAEGPEAISAQTSGLPRPQSGLAVTEGEGEQVHFLVTELLEGETLRDRLKAGGLSVRKAVETAVQIAQGLAAAHEKGIIHRDLKPANVFVTNDGHVKILDFGIAKLTAPAGLEQPAQATTVVDATEAGTTLGTLGYMAPEQIRGLSADHRTDIFAFGCVLYEMLSGRRAFLGDTPADTMTAILTKDPEPLSGTGRGIAPALQEIVSRCLEKSPEDRLSSAHDLALALRAESPAPITPAAVRRHVGPWRWLWAGVAALGVIAAAGVALYLLTVRGHAGAPTTAGLIRSIAVLPLTNLSGDPAQEYFSDGMTEELITTLSKISALKVISRTSVMQFKGSKKPLREIAAALGVEGVIEGSVLRAGERVRITAQLINASTDTHLWAESYDRDLKDVLALQAEVARAVAGEVRAKLTPQEQARLAGSRTVNPEAYRLFLEARQLWLNMSSEEQCRKALERFQQAIDLDPTYAPAYVGLANSHLSAGGMGFEPAYEGFPKAKVAALKALEFDKGLAEAHAVLGAVMFQADWDWPGAERELQRALALGPNNSDAHWDYGFYLMLVAGRPDLAVTEYRRALEFDPLATTNIVGLGWGLYYARRHDESIAHFRRALEQNPTGVGAWGHTWLGLNYAQKHMVDEAVAECGKAVESRPEDQVVLGYCGCVYGLVGRHQQAKLLLDRLKSLSARHYVDPCFVAILCDGLGDNNRTMEWLERAYTERSASSYGIRGELWTDKLRSDPRFQDLIRRMHYPASTTP